MYTMGADAAVESEHRTLLLVRHMGVIKHYYPDSDNWIVQKVAPDLGSSRKIFFEYRGGTLAGFAIAKASSCERKLCTIWVSPTHRSQGLGTGLVSRAMGWLKTDAPVLTIPASLLPDFNPLLRRWNFSETQVLSLYRSDCPEHVFNGYLSPKVRVGNKFDQALSVA